MPAAPVTRTMMGEYAVFKRLRDECVTAMEKFGLTDFDVRRFAQANLATGDKLVLLNHISNDRVGWQGFQYAKNGLRTDEWIDEQTWQISFIKKMRQGDTVETVTADDMCSYAVAWLNGQGMVSLKSDGIALLIIDSNDIMVYNDDSDLYQRRPVLTMKAQIVKKFTESYAWTDVIQGGHLTV